MKAILFSVIVLTASVACGQVLVVSDIPDTPTLAPADCDCLICDCVDCDGNCGEAEAPIKLVSVRKQAVEEHPSEAALRRHEERERSASEYRWVQTGTERVQTGTRTVCGGGSCRAVATYATRPVYGWKLFAKQRVHPAVQPPVQPVRNKSTSVPVRFTGGLAATEYEADGVVIEREFTPTNSTGGAASSQYYPVQGPYSGSYASGNGCGGDMGSGCSGAGGGCAGRGRGLLGFGLFGRRKG